MAGPSKRRMMDFSEKRASFAFPQTDTILTFLKDIKYELALQRNVLQDHTLKIESISKLILESQSVKQQIMLDIREIRMDNCKCKDSVFSINNSIKYISQLVQENKDICMDMRYSNPPGHENAVHTSYLAPDYSNHGDHQYDNIPVTNDDPELNEDKQDNPDTNLVDNVLLYSKVASTSMDVEHNNEHVMKKQMMSKKRSPQAWDMFGPHQLCENSSINLFIPKRPGENCFSVIHAMCQKACQAYVLANPGQGPPKALFFDELPYDRGASGVQYSLIDRIVQQIDHMFDLGTTTSKARSIFLRKKVVKAFSNIRTNQARLRSRRARSHVYHQHQAMRAIVKEETIEY